MAAGRIKRTSPISHRIMAAAIAAVSMTAVSGEIAADADLTGSWSGGGSVSFSGGSSEKARCRVTYSKSSPVSYAVNATCATASGKVAQTASVKRSGPSSFTGSFYNADFDESGNIFVSVNGNSQNVKLTSSRASASLRLSR